MMAGHPSASLSKFPIEKVEVSAYTIPTDYPESDGTIEWDRTTIVIVELHTGQERGLGYTYADLSTATLIDSALRDVIQGQDAMDIPAVWLSMIRRIRNLGRPGIASMAISAVDIALWDLKARILRLPLVKLLGTVREGIPTYGSGGFTSYSVSLSDFTALTKPVLASRVDLAWAYRLGAGSRRPMVERLRFRVP